MTRKSENEERKWGGRAGDRGRYATVRVSTVPDQGSGGVGDDHRINARLHLRHLPLPALHRPALRVRQLDQRAIRLGVRSGRRPGSTDCGPATYEQAGIQY